MFVREDLNTTLGDLSTMLAERNDGSDAIRVAPEDIKFHLDASDPSISLGDREVPATDHAMSAFGDLLQVPSAFVNRAKGKVQAETMNALFNDLLVNTLQKDARVTLRQDAFLEDIDEWGKEGIKPRQLVTTAINVIDETAHVARLIDTPQFFGFDVYAPEGFSHGYGGDGVTPYADGNERDDITAGGLRYGVNLKQGLAPFVQPWFFRLACTNGWEIEKAGLKVDARGQTVDEVIAELEQMAQIAFGGVEREIAAFYELKNQPVENVERTLRSIARERGIPDRSFVALTDLAQGEDLPDSPTMFDVVNLITNFANSPAIRNDGGRLLLERAGGHIVGDHAARCGHCQQKVTA